MSCRNYATAFALVSDRASEGHYLDRLIAICDACGHQSEAKLLRANAEYLAAHCKPAGLDTLIFDVSFGLIVLAKRQGCTAVDFIPVAWGLDSYALEDTGLGHVRIPV